MKNKNKNNFRSIWCFKKMLTGLKNKSCYFWILFSLAFAVIFVLWIPKVDILMSLLAIFFGLIITLLSYIGIQNSIIQNVCNGLKEYTIRWRVFVVLVSLFIGVWLSLNIPLIPPPPEYNPYMHPIIVRMIYRTATSLCIGLIILLVSFWATGSLELRVKPTSATKFLSVIKYAAPILFIWGTYLLAFYPGMMSSDSIDQWGQSLTGVYNDHHPAFHTLSIWLVTRIALTPTLVAIAQILFLGIVAAHWFVFFEQIGLSRLLIWASLSIFSLSPVNGTMVNTLWKDIPFSTSVLALSLLLAKIVFSGGQWIQSWKAKILLGITCVLVLLFRHDGLPLGAGTIVALFVFYPGKWKNWAIAAIICFGLYFGVRGPLYQLVGVQKTTVLAESSLSLYSIAAYAKEGSQAEQLIQSFQIFSPTWDCRLAGKIQPEWRSTDLDYSQSPIQILANLIQRMPKVLLYFYHCARSMEWILWNPYEEVYNASHVELLVDANPYGIQPDSKIPWLRDVIRDWVINTSHNPNINWFTWRPALFLYFNLFVSLTLILRNRSLKFGLISLPILIQSVTFSLIFAAPNFRYHYAVYLVSLISWPLIFLPPLQLEEKTEA